MVPRNRMQNVLFKLVQFFSSYLESNVFTLFLIQRGGKRFPFSGLFESKMFSIADGYCKMRGFFLLVI